MDCLIDLIGIKGCDTPDAEVYINDLPGVTFESIEKLSNADQETYLGVWADVQKRGIRKFIRKAQQAFNRRYTGLECCEGCSFEDLLCGYKNGLVDALLYSLGVELMLERIYSDRLNEYTTVQKDEAEELRDYFQVESEDQLELAINNIPADLINHCYECRNNIQRVETLP